MLRCWLVLASIVLLHDEADRRAFTAWFTFLAESQAFTEPRPEVSDCAGLIRFAYTGALRPKDLANIDLPAVPPIPPVRVAPTGRRLFRTASGALAEFADAQSLVRYNCRFVTRDVRRARPGDLLFFRQLEQTMPFHLMVFLGPSQIEPAQGPFVVYHTGPGGEVRRPSLAELLAHPLPRWRPLASNDNFLGVYRWNILTD